MRNLSYVLSVNMVLIFHISVSLPEAFAGTRATLVTFKILSSKTHEPIGPGTVQCDIELSSVGKWWGEDWHATFDRMTLDFDQSGSLDLSITFSSAPTPMEMTAQWSATIDVAGFYGETISGSNRISRSLALFGTPDFTTNTSTRTVFLRPMKEEVELSGEVGLNNKQDLGVLSAEDIARSLQVNLSDIVSLIESKKLAGKKIGDKYFVTKKDFEEWMSKK